MIQPPQRTYSLCLLVILAALLTACSSAPYRYEPLERFDVVQRAVTQEQGGFVVRASVPGEQEAEDLFGIPLYKRKIQPIWLEITNVGDDRARVVLSSIDREYFSPLEVAYMHKSNFSKQGWMDMEDRLHADALPRHIGPGQSVSGFVFTHASKGTKAFNLDIYRIGKEAAESYEQFTFFIEVPGFVPDHRDVNFRQLYSADEIRDVDKDGLRAVLAEVPCCTSSQDGAAHGRPVQVFFVAEGQDLLRALLRAGWNETSYERDKDYLAGADYFFGRPPDAIFRKGRDRSTERAELALWLAPVRADGQPLWVGQFKNAIGRTFAIGELFLGVTLDPDTNDGRNYILQDMWYAQAMRHWAWSETGHAVPKDAPQQDIHGNPWFSADAYRVVIWISGEPVAMADVTPVNWDRPGALREVKE